MALPLGELSPQVTERALQPGLNDKVECLHTPRKSLSENHLFYLAVSNWLSSFGMVIVTLSVIAALGHLSQRERRGAHARHYTARRIVDFYDTIICLDIQEQAQQMKLLCLSTVL